MHRAFRQLDHAAFEHVLGKWFAAQGLAPKEALAIDGKTLRVIHGEHVPGVKLVAVYAHQTRVVLAQAETITAKAMRWRVPRRAPAPPGGVPLREKASISQWLSALARVTGKGVIHNGCGMSLLLRAAPATRIPTFP